MYSIFNFEKVGFDSHHPVSLPLVLVQRSLKCRKDRVILFGLLYITLQPPNAREKLLLKKLKPASCIFSSSQHCLILLIKVRCDYLLTVIPMVFAISQYKKTNTVLKKQQKTTSGIGRVPAPIASGKCWLYCTET